MFPCVYNNCAAIEIIKLKRDLLKITDIKKLCILLYLEIII